MKLYINVKVRDKVRMEKGIEEIKLTKRNVLTDDPHQPCWEQQSPNGDPKHVVELLQEPSIEIDFLGVGELELVRGG